MPRDLSGQILGEYILRNEIGVGGYGAVYRAEQSLLDRDVVVKVLDEECRDEISRGRFLREAKLASQLDHPYAVHVYAAGAEREDGLLWIAMELVRGVSLGGWLKEHRRMPLEQFVPFFERVCEVVEAAHRQGIVHRDLKPSNIMVTEHGGRLLPKLLDFGIAKMVKLAQPTSEPLEAPTEDRNSDDVVGAADTDPTRPRAIAIPGLRLESHGLVGGRAPVDALRSLHRLAGLHGSRAMVRCCGGRSSGRHLRARHRRLPGAGGIRAVRSGHE